MQAIKSLFSAAAFLLLAVGFIVFIWFELHSGIAAGNFGVADLREMPGVYCFVIGAQIAIAVAFILRAVKSVSGMPTGRIAREKNLLTRPMALSVIIQAAALFILILLGLWAGFEIVVRFYKLIAGMDMPAKAVYAVMALLITLVFFFLLYNFGVLNFIQEYYSKLPSAMAVLRRKKRFPR
jgi:hypothetical protein